MLAQDSSVQNTADSVHSTISDIIMLRPLLVLHKVVVCPCAVGADWSASTSMQTGICGQ